MRATATHFGTLICFIDAQSGKRGSNSRPLPWQGSALPLSYSRIAIQPTVSLISEQVGKRGVEPLRRKALVPKTSVSAISPLARGNPV